MIKIKINNKNNSNLIKVIQYKINMMINKITINKMIFNRIIILFSNNLIMMTNKTKIK